MKKKKLLTLFGSVCLILALAALLLPGCAKEEVPVAPPVTPVTPTPVKPAPVTPAPEKPTKEEIVFGYSSSLSGAYSIVGLAIKQGYEVWADWVNDEGGIYVAEYGKKLPVRLMMYDDKSDPATCAKVYEKLITVDKVDFLLSPWGSSLGFAMSSICEKYKMPMVFMWVATDSIFQQGYEYIFGSIPVASMHEWNSVNLMKEVGGLLKVYFITPKELYPKCATEGGYEYAKELGFEAYYEEVEKGVTDFTATIVRMKELGIEAMFTGMYQAEGFLLFRQMEELGFQPKFISAPHAADLPAFWETFGERAQGVVAGGFYSWDWKTPRNEEFVTRYKAMTGDTPTHYGATLAMGEIMQQAIEKAGTLDKEKVMDVLRTEEFSCVCYPIVKFETLKGMPQLNPYGYVGALQWQNGKLYTVYPSDIATAEVIYPKPW